MYTNVPAMQWYSWGAGGSSADFSGSTIQGRHNEWQNDEYFELNFILNHTNIINKD
jgi:hypothetical protein